VRRRRRRRGPCAAESETRPVPLWEIAIITSSSKMSGWR